MIRTLAMCMSFTGLYGVRKKRPWGPLVCGCASTVWFLLLVFQIHEWQYAVVEFAYAATNFGIAWAWRRDDAIR